VAQLWVRNTPHESKTEPSGEPTRGITLGLTDLLARLKESHKVFFLYDQEKLQGKQVKVDPTQLKDVEKTLGRVLPPLKLHYKKLNDKNFLILTTDQEPTPGSSGVTPGESGDARTPTGDLTLLASQGPGLLTMVPDRRVSGRVSSSENGEGLPGVSVRVKNSTAGTVTNNNGEFSLSVPDNANVLVFSSVGFITQEVPIDGLSVLDVKLAVDQKNLDEVVVVGYGTQRRKDLTGAVASVKGSDIKNLPATDINTALQGRVPGAFVTANDGAPGASAKIYIRGPVSINGGDPLYVVDGVPFVGTGYNFNIQDIESIEVLKDASAAAIYGAKAAAGVILITTKRGKAGQLHVSFNANYGVRNVFNLPQTLRRDSYIQAKKAFGFDVNDLYGDATRQSQLPDTDWFRETYRQGKEQNYTVSMAGGGDKSTFYISTNYNKIDGTHIGNWIERYTLRINSDHKITKRLKFSETLYGKYGNDTPNAATGQGNLSFRNTPVMPVYDPTNPLGGWGRAPKGFQGGNDVQAAIGSYRRNKNFEINLAGTLDYELLDGLHLRGTLGTSLFSTDNYYYDYKADIGTTVNREDFNKYYEKSQAYIGTYTLNYDRTFGLHTVKALLGYEARKRDYGNLFYSNFNPLTPRPSSSDLVQSVTNATGTFYQDNVYDRILSQFARFEYSYAGKYLLTANVRRDGYGSKFGPTHKFGVFPGLSAGWVISSEDFMKTLPAVSFLKLRAGYGVLGNSVVRDFAYATSYTQGYSYDFTVGGGTNKQNSIGLASQLPNPDIQWESVATANVGLDGALWQNKLTFNLDYYSRQTRKMIYNVPIAPSAGMGGDVPANIGQMSNKGMELYLEYRNKVGDFSYTVGLNGAFNRNKLISLNPDLGKLTVTSGYLNEFYGSQQPNRSEPGLPLGQFYGYQTDGIYATNAASGEARPKVGDYVPKVGDLRYVDQNGDGVINADDKVYIGNPWPKFTYGTTLGAGYKGFDLRAFFSGVQGNQIYNAFESFEHMFFSDYTTTSKIYETSFFNGNGLTDKPRVGTITDVDLTNNGNWAYVSSYHVQNGSYLRMRNLQLGYTVPPSVLSKLRMSSLRVFVMGDNLFTITKYKGINPEIAPLDGNILQQGIDMANGRYPMSRLVSLGLNAEF
jgi:TonB-linked SusC/RagA family outer membrane protein